jgi:hypothetical protein
VWDLETRQKIRDYKICDIIPDDNSGEPSFTKFSELNTDIIYFSGKFPKSKTEERIWGFVNYSITENRIIDSTFGVGPLRVGQGYFTFFDNENRAIILIGNFISILNLNKKTIEQKINRDTVTNGPAYWFGIVNYSTSKKVFVGFGLQFFGYCKNNLNTRIEEPFHYDSIIFPNPNTGFVSLQTNCQNENQSYEILDLNGLILIPNTIITTQQGTLSIDISSLPDGTYFLRFHCGSSVFTYKVIKEN